MDKKLRRGHFLKTQQHCPKQAFFKRNILSQGIFEGVFKRGQAQPPTPPPGVPQTAYASHQQKYALKSAVTNAALAQKKETAQLLKTGAALGNRYQIDKL